MSNQELSSVESDIKNIIKNETSNSQAGGHTASSITTTTASSITTTTASSNVSNKKDKVTSLMNFFLDTLSHDDDSKQNKKSTTSIAKQVTEEIKSYRKLAMQFVSVFNDNHNPLEFWKQNQLALPYLTPLAKKYLSTPATSIKSESAFSISAYYGRKQRAQLSSTNLSFSVLLKDKLMNENVETMS